MACTAPPLRAFLITGMSLRNALCLAGRDPASDNMFSLDVSAGAGTPELPDAFD